MMVRSLGISVVVLLTAVPLRGQVPSSDGLWQPVAGPPERIRAFGIDLELPAPAQMRAFRLDTSRLTALFARIRPSLDGDSPVMSIPMPDGRFVDFRVEETQVMPRELAAELGNFRTFRGQSVSDPRVTARIEHGPEGLRAVVFSPAGRTFVEPVRRPEPAYVSYPEGLGSPPPPPQDDGEPRCQVQQQDVNRLRAELDRARALDAGRAAARPEDDAPGSTLRTYRLAVAATSQYTRARGGTVDAAARAIASTIHRVNEVYERDLAVTFSLVPQQTRLIQADPKSDPYQNDDADQLIAKNQEILDGVLGTSGYDLGHVFSTGRGGKAFPGACDAGRKAMATTGRANPVGDPFDIDYVAHEIGHQLGANHTFNTADGRCAPHRAAASAYEPGSGSTILAYAGVCGRAASLQPNSHDYMHAGSLAEIRDFMTGGGDACATRTAVSNTPPAVSVPHPIVVVPKRTPFTLSGSAVDREQRGLLFTWEQMDVGLFSPPEGDGDGQPRPLFRSNLPSAEATRSFPALDVLRSGASRVGETLPQTPRDMVFRLTARDAARPAGGFGFADVTVRVAGAGPFEVTAPPAGAAVAAGSTQTVRWTVNGTDGGEVGCTTVRIRLSTDDAGSFTEVLAPATPNDGSERVTIPLVTAVHAARIRVECATQPFFNVSRRFTIGP